MTANNVVPPAGDSSQISTANIIQPSTQPINPYAQQPLNINPYANQAPNPYLQNLQAQSAQQTTQMAQAAAQSVAQAQDAAANMTPNATENYLQQIVQKIPAEQRATLAERIRQGDKIKTIQEVREATGAGLADAKAIVDDFEKFLL